MEPRLQKIGRYKIIRRLGRGGMGMVYLAHDPFIDRLAAIKTSLKPPPSDPEHFDLFQKGFFNEARAAERLSHRNIVSVFDASVDEYHSYLVMEYVEGSTLRKFTFKENLLPINKVVNIVFQCAKALDYAHHQGVIHRDIKPGNVLISTDGRPKISDFGIAAVKGGSEPEALSRLTGSVAYAAPEYLKGEALTPQADIFSLGSVMFELLTGRTPFQAETDVAMFFKITNETAPVLKNIRDDAPESLGWIVSRCLEKDLDQRYQSGMQLAQDLIASFDHLRNLREELLHQEKLNVIKKIHFFKEFSASELAEVINATKWVKFEAAQTIIQEGEVDDTFFILVSGEVAVKKRGKWLAKLSAGDCFGEMAYLGKTKRTATIQAVTNTILMEIRASFIDQTSMSTQLRFYKVFSQTLIHRLARTSDLLSKEGW
ncbi:MAG: serine/threonine-protein kinase [Pseudomonadota bacterium]